MSESNDMTKELFAHLVILLASSTMQHLGKVVNPATNATEVNLEAAQSSIDLLDMLEAKTRGNLDKDEDRFLKTTLAQLKMNFVETANAQPAGQPAPAPQPIVEPAAVESKPAGEDDKRKFHKKYE